MKKAAGRNIFTIVGTVVVLCAMAAPVGAAPGAAGASFLKFTPNPRATGMGDSHVSVSEDAYSTYWNPAGLAVIEVPEFATMYNSSFEDVNMQYLAAAWPLEYGSTLGFGLSRLTVSPFQGYDSIGVRTGMVDSSALSAGFSYGRAIFKDEISRPFFTVGAGLKYIDARLDSASARTFAGDLGAIYTLRPANYWLREIPAQEFRIGFAARNLGPGLKFDSENTPLPASVSLGGSWHSYPGGNSNLILSLDNVVQKGDGYYLALGTEFTAFQLLSMRAGFRTGQAMGSGIRAGIGLHLSFIDLDYSMSPFGDLGNMHKFGLSMKFGRSKARQPLSGETNRAAKARLMAPKEKIEKLEMFAQDFLSLAKKDLEERRYVSALKNMRKALNLDPALRGGAWGARETRLDAIVKGLRLNDIPAREQSLSVGAEQADVAAEAINAYLESSDVKALLLAQAAYGTNIRGATIFEELLNLISGLANVPIRRNEILPKTAMIRQKLETAGNAFYRGGFDSAARQCEEVLLLENDNKLAWKRLGSSYFALGDTAEAKRAYEKALKLDPEDKSLLKFLKLQDWNQP